MYLFGLQVLVFFFRNKKIICKLTDHHGFYFYPPKTESLETFPVMKYNPYVLPVQCTGKVRRSSELLRVGGGEGRINEMVLN